MKSIHSSAQVKNSFFVVRGESLLSSIENDSFFMKDNTSASYETNCNLPMLGLAKRQKHTYCRERPLTRLEEVKNILCEVDTEGLTEELSTRFC